MGKEKKKSRGAKFTQGSEILLVQCKRSKTDNTPALEEREK